MTEVSTLPAQEEFSFSSVSRVLAHFISVIFHPLFVNIYMAAFLIYWDPEWFISFNEKGKFLKLLTVINNNFVFPVLVVLLMRGLGFSKSFLLRTQRDRIVPYIACTTFFFWTWFVFRKLPGVSEDMVNMCFAVFLSVCVALFLNSYFKISMHAIGVGGLVGLMIVLVLNGKVFSGLPLAVSLIIAGIVFAARKIVSDHRWFDLAAGFAVGLLCEFLAFWIF
jgi:hypothetical protein